jgi:hypothetical protein
MENEDFNPKQMRLTASPAIPRAEMARRMKVSYNFLYQLEVGRLFWPPARKEQFKQIVSEWAVNPPQTTKIRRSDFGKKHRKPRRRRRAKLKVMGTQGPVPVAHSHGEIVGIG